MTCCTAPAKAAGVEQFGPSLLPCQPPKEIWTLPPLALDRVDRRRVGAAGQRAAAVPGGVAAAAGQDERHGERLDAGGVHDRARVGRVAPAHPEVGRAGHPGRVRVGVAAFGGSGGDGVARARQVAGGVTGPDRVGVAGGGGPAGVGVGGAGDGRHEGRAPVDVVAGDAHVVGGGVPGQRDAAGGDAGRAEVARHGGGAGVGAAAAGDDLPQGGHDVRLPAGLGGVALQALVVDAVVGDAGADRVRGPRRPGGGGDDHRAVGGRGDGGEAGDGQGEGGE